MRPSAACSVRGCLFPATIGGGTLGPSELEGDPGQYFSHKVQHTALYCTVLHCTVLCCTVFPCKYCTTHRT